jgi:hypothetical protein
MLWILFAVTCLVVITILKICSNGVEVCYEVPLLEAVDFVDGMDIQCADGARLSLELQKNKKEILQLEKVSTGFKLMASNASWSAKRFSNLKEILFRSGDVGERCDARVIHLLRHCDDAAIAKELLVDLIRLLHDGSEEINVVRLYIDGDLKKITGKDMIKECADRGFVVEKRD